MRDWPLAKRTVMVETGSNAAGLKQKNRDGKRTVAGGDEWS